MSEPESSAAETFNPWSVVNVVFHHLAAKGLHPVLGEAGDPARPAAELLRVLGIEPGAVRTHQAGRQSAAGRFANRRPRRPPLTRSRHLTATDGEETQSRHDNDIPE